jgi:hypothetical protein
MSGFASEMAEFDDEFKQAEPVEGTGVVMFSDGSHQAAISEARVEQGTYGWQLMLKFEGHDSRMRRHASARKWYNLPPEPERVQYLAADLSMLGYDYKKRGLSGLEAACVAEEFIGLLCDIGVKTKAGAERDYTNVYINGCHGKVANLADYTGGEGAVAFSSAEADDDDIPF